MAVSRTAGQSERRISSFMRLRGTVSGTSAARQACVHGGAASPAPSRR